MRNKFLIFVVGKTSSGKDAVAKYIRERYNIPMICSYTTRAMRDYEVDGIQHYFVSKERMRKILDTESIIAYAKFPKTNIEYCTTLESIKSDVAVYIIDPSGLDWFKSNGCISGTRFFSIYIDLDEDIILQRAKDRGDKSEDIVTRLDSEREMFNSFKESKGYDYIINNSGSYDDLIAKVDSVLSNEGF